MPPETRYAKSGDINIAYQVVGDGPFDLVYVPGWVERRPPLGKAGLHTGECELMRDKIGGIAVHTGARVVAAAEPGEVLVSSTVKDLVAGSGITFADRGERELKGVGSWRLYSVIDA